MSHDLKRIDDRIFDTRLYRLHQRLVIIAFLLGAANTYAGPSIEVGSIEVEPATPISLAFFVPIISGDDNYNAIAEVEYREEGQEAWLTGLPLLRIRPEFAHGDSRVESFSGSIFHLEAGTTYEVRINIQDSDGGSANQTILTSTASHQATEPANPNEINVSSAAALRHALENAAPGDVITLAPGVYDGGFIIDYQHGTQENPIVIRGSDREASVIRGGDRATFHIYSSSFVILEDVTIDSISSSNAIFIQNAHDVAVRRNLVRASGKGIYVTSGSNRNIEVHDNVLQGSNSWPTIDNSTWDDEGIAVCGQGISIFRNTLSGFGDALGLNRFCDTRIRSIDIHNNKVLWSGDDAIELDDGERNIRAFENLAVNTATLISIQHNNDYGGPTYAFRNVGINQARRPFKLNDGPSGFYILHNTAVKTSGADSWVWTQYNNGSIDNFQIKNNILVSLSPTTSRIVAFEAPARVADYDYNGYYPDGDFWYGALGSYSDFQSAQHAGVPHDNNGQILSSPIFETAITLGSDYTTKAFEADVALDPDSSAIDAGTRITGINDFYRGNAPDLGAIELGNPAPEYGARIAGGGGFNVPLPPVGLTSN